MAEPKIDKLFVNVNAAQARRRLKGFGSRVREVQSAGPNQSIIIHCATGQRLRELFLVFADVGASKTEVSLSEPISNLNNLGPMSSQWLRDVGILTITDLQRMGPTVAFRLVRQRRPRVSLNLLWAMAAGLISKDWRKLSQRDKERLLAELDDG